MASPQTRTHSGIELLRTITMGSAIAIIIGGLSLLGFDLYRSLIEQTENARNDLKRSFADTQRQTFVYSSMLAQNPQVQRGTHFRLTGSLLNQLIPTLQESKVDRISIHDSKSVVMALAHAPEQINIQDNHKHLQQALQGTTLSTIYNQDGQWHLETAHPIFHQMEKELILGALSVGYTLDDNFALNLEQQVGHPIILTHHETVLGSSLVNDSPKQWDSLKDTFTHAETNYQVVKVPLHNPGNEPIQAVILVNTISEKLTLVWVALSIPALVFVLFRERSRALHKEKYQAKERLLVKERQANEKVQAEVKRRRHAQQELEVALEKVTEASRLKSEFLATVSHELRTPLNAIMNIPKGLLKDYTTMDCWTCKECQAVFQDPNGELDTTQVQECPDCQGQLTYGHEVSCTGNFREHKSFLERIARSGSHLLHLIDDVLDMSKLEAGAAQLRLSHFTFDRLFTELSELTSKLAEEKSLKVRYPGPINPRSLDADYVKIVQVLVNLLGNAIKFTPDGGTISIAVEHTSNPSSVVFKISDSGIGIPENNLKTIFESFRQVDGSATRSHQGSGLGLSISKGLVELHGGTISVQSTVGQGSVFQFSIPQYQNETA